MKKFIWLICGVGLILTSCSKDEPLSFQEQLAADGEAIDNYLSANTITAQTDPSGLRYVITSLGTGPKPTLSNSIKVKYKGMLLSNGQIFDQANSAVVFKLSTLIQGWKIGFQLLPAGSKATLYIPSGLAYGAQATGSIPANSNLIFEVELFEVI
ncbi:MAG: FKBP-type peptidyl-prolyl cis-trans isomerase [Cyclobacteriaceae bacterium]|nr:FKBP-type peptidyl-prolyl cis-trans isomerase [Cyclobacteriaceae bacterium]